VFVEAWTRQDRIPGSVVHSHGCARKMNGLPLGGHDRIHRSNWPRGLGLEPPLPQYHTAGQGYPPLSRCSDAEGYIRMQHA